MTISADDRGGYIASGLPDGSTKHVYAGNCTVIVKVTDEFANVLGELEFLIPYQELKLSLEHLAVRYGAPYFGRLREIVKDKIPNTEAFSDSDREADDKE